MAGKLLMALDAAKFTLKSVEASCIQASCIQVRTANMRKARVVLHECIKPSATWPGVLIMGWDSHWELIRSHVPTSHLVLLNDVYITSQSQV